MREFTVRSSVERYVACLLEGRRPKPFAASDGDVAQIRTAIELIGRRAELGRPTEAFVDRLRRNLTARQSGMRTWHRPLIVVHRRREP